MEHDGVWDQTLWPMPHFARVDLIDGTAWEVEYDQDDPSKYVTEWRVPLERASELPSSGLMGDQFVIERLKKLLGN